MKRLALLLLIVQSLFWGGPVLAQDPAAYRTVTRVAWVEEWDPAEQRWIRLADTSPPMGARSESQPFVAEQIERPDQSTTIVMRAYQAARFAVPGELDAHAGRKSSPIAQYGPFVVLDEGRAAMIGSTDGTSPKAFDTMLRDFPTLTVLELVEAPGTSNDIANLALGRKIRAAGLATHVPQGGSVRSGAVELFLAGTRRSMADSASFAVHSWLDNYGRQPADFAIDAPENRLYLDYYMEMGMSEDLARAFYALTNSVPHESARWLSAEEMRSWVQAANAAARARAEVALVQPPVVTVAVIGAKPLPAPVVALSIPAFDPVPEPQAPLLAAPLINYRDTVQIARVQPAFGYAYLDSVL
jgi:hypothetical protein